MKFFLSNAPADTPLTVLLRVAFDRWRIERMFEDSKGELGLDHFEVRRYGSLCRHRKRTVQRLRAYGFRMSDLTPCQWPKK